MLFFFILYFFLTKVVSNKYCLSYQNEISEKDYIIFKNFKCSLVYSFSYSFRVFTCAKTNVWISE